MEEMSDVSGIALLNSSDNGQQFPTYTADSSSLSVDQMTEVQKQLESFLKASRLARGRSECESDDLGMDSVSEASDAETEQLLAENMSPSHRSILPITSSSNAFLSSLIGLSSGEGLNPLAPHCQETTANTTPKSGKSENQILCENLDRERLRRKICEQKIQDLQKSMLQLQQRFTVSASTNKKQELMIEQLEKTLRGIISGWQQQQQQRADVTRKLQQEKQLLEEACSRHREAYGAIELQLEQKSQKLDDTVKLQDQQKKQLTEERTRSLELLSKEHEKVTLLEEEKASLLATNAEFTTSLQREHAVCEHLREEMNQLDTEHKAHLQAERERSEKENKVSKQYQEMISSLQLDTQRMGNMLDQLKTEKEGLIMKMQLKQSEYAASLVKLRAELQATWETELMTKLTEAQEEAEKWQYQMHEQYRTEMTDLTHQHNREMMSWKLRLDKEWEERFADQRSVLVETEEKVKLLEEQLEHQKLARRTAEDRSDSISVQLKALVRSHCEQALAIIGDTAVTKKLPVEVQSLPSPPNFNDDNQLQLLPSTRNHSDSIQHTPITPDVDGNPMLQVSADNPIRSAQSRLFASPPVRLAASNRDADRGGVTSENLKHVTSLSWSAHSPVLSLGTRDNTQETSSAQVTFPSTATTTRYSSMNTSVSSSSQLDSFEDKLQFHKKQQDELRQYVRLLLNRIPSQPLVESADASDQQPLSVASPSHLSTTSPLFSPIQSTSVLHPLSAPVHVDDNSTQQQVQSNLPKRQHSSHEHISSISTASIYSSQSESATTLTAKQSQTGRNKVKKLGNQMSQEAVRRSLEVSFQQERNRIPSTAKADRMAQGSKQAAASGTARASSQAKPWK